MTRMDFSLGCLQSPENSKLQDWRPVCLRHQRIGFKLVITFALLATCGLYVLLVVRSFDVESTHVWIMSPSDDSSKAFDETLVGKVDLPQLIALNYACRIEHTIREALPKSVLRFESGNSLNQSIDQLITSSTRQNHRRKSMIIYMSGILGENRTEPSLCCSSNSAIGSGDALSMKRLMDVVQGLPYRRVLLCLDVHRSQDARLESASLIAWKHLVDCIETQLIHADRTPVAVQLHYSLSDKSSVPEDASRFAEHLRSRILEKSDILQAIRQTYSPIRSNDKSNQCTSHWMVSANWPIEFDNLNGTDGSIKTATSNLAQVTSSSNEADAKIAPASPLTVYFDKNSPDVDSQLELAKVEQLFQLTNELLKDWRTETTESNCPILSLPCKASFRSCNPVVYESLRDLHERLLSLHRWSPSSLKTQWVRTLARTMLSFDIGIPVSSTAPPWMQVLPITVSASIEKPTDSLVANATLYLLGLMTHSRGEADLKTLCELATLLEHARSAADLTAWLDANDKEAGSVDEIAWIKTIVAQFDIPWNLQRSLIVGRLQSERVSIDPLTAEWCRDAVQNADTLRLSAERTCLDRITSHWSHDAQVKALEANRLYADALEQLERVRTKLASYAALTHLSHSLFKKISLTDVAHRPISSEDIADEIDTNSDRVFQILAPWNRRLAREWVEGCSLHKKKLINASQSQNELGIAISQFEQFQRDRSESFRSWLTASKLEIPKHSSFWIFAYHHWTSPTKNFMQLISNSKEPIVQILDSKLDQLKAESFGSSLSESRSLTLRHSAWSMLHPASAAAIDNSHWNALNWMGESVLKFFSGTSAKTDMTLIAKDRTLPVKLQFEYEADELEVYMDQKPVAPGVDLEVTDSMNKRIPVRLSIHKKPTWTASRSIRLTATQGKVSQRTLIGLETAKPIVKLRITNQSRHPLGTSSLGQMESILASDAFESSLAANQVNELAFQLANVSQTASHFVGVLYALPNLSNPVPSGAISLEDAKRWKNSVAGLAELAIANPCFIAPEQSCSLWFPTQPWLPDAKPLPVERLFLEVQQESTGLVQFLPWKPNVLHPRQYVDVKAKFDLPSRSLQVHVAIDEEARVAQNGVQVDLQLLASDDLHVVAKARANLTGDSVERGHASRVLSTASCSNSSALLCVHVDGWPSSMLFDVDLSKSNTCTLSKSFAAIRIQSLEKNEIIHSEQRAIELIIDAFLNDEHFDAQNDAIHVGMDLNSNRVLQDDSTLVLRSPVSIQFLWNGVGMNGNPNLHSVVQSNKVSIMVPSDRNRVVPAMAEIRIGKNHFYSNAHTFVLDRVLPQISSVRVLDKQPIAIGKLLPVEILVSDDGLSDIAMVEGGWSTTGELEVYEGMLLQPAVYRDRSRWILTLATDALPSGKTSLLVRARDRAGNVGPAYASTLDLQTEPELLRRAASLRTQVYGKVFLGSKPQKSMQVRLLPHSESNVPVDKPSSLPKKEDMLELPTAETMNDGSFVLRSVPTGNFNLEVSGIVRGIREKRTETIVVDAASGPVQTTVRLDKRP